MDYAQQLERIEAKKARDRQKLNTKLKDRGPEAKG